MHKKGGFVEMDCSVPKLKALMREIYFLAYTDGMKGGFKVNDVAKRAMDNLICFNDDSESKEIFHSIEKTEEPSDDQ
jgi:hypothetical protein